MSTAKFPVTDPATAAQQTANWRKYYAHNAYAAIHYQGDIPVDDPEFQKLEEDAFRGFRIPLNDLKQIMKDIEEYNAEEGQAEPVNSIRIYLARATPDPAKDADVHVYLVPVAGGDAIPNPLQKIVTPIQQYGSDILKLASGQFTLYNFSTPCPKQCDVESPLFALKKPGTS